MSFFCLNARGFFGSEFHLHFFISFSFLLDVVRPRKDEAFILKRINLYQNPLKIFPSLPYVRIRTCLVSNVWERYLPLLNMLHRDHASSMCLFFKNSEDCVR